MFMNYRGIGVSNLPNVKYRSFCRAGIDFNVMIAGSSGLGKSSFVNQVLGEHVLLSDPFLDAGDGTESREIFGCKDPRDAQEDKYLHKNSVLNIQISKLFVMENEFQTRVTITEVDGIGDNVCNEGCWEPVTELINDNFGDFLGQEKKNVRALIKDKRIHVCLYFLEPNPGYVRMSDIRTMKEISRVCNLIPVVGKSDLLNDAQKQEHHDKILEILSAENIDTFPLDISEGERAEASSGPFFIISKGIDPKGGAEQTCREYPWGTMNPEQVRNNDFRLLKEALVSKNLINLIEATEDFYDGYKTREMGRSIGSAESPEKDDRRLTREIQNKIREDERTVMEMRRRLLEKKQGYKSRLVEMTGCCDEN